MCETCCFVKRDTMIARHMDNHKHWPSIVDVHIYCVNREKEISIDFRSFVGVFVCSRLLLHFSICSRFFSPFHTLRPLPLPIALAFCLQSYTLTHTLTLTHLLLLLLMLYYIYVVVPCAIDGAKYMHIYVYISKCVQRSLPANGQ